jgi:hypothetical protein
MKLFRALTTHQQQNGTRFEVVRVERRVPPFDELSDVAPKRHYGNGIRSYCEVLVCLRWFVSVAVARWQVVADVAAGS